MFKQMRRQKRELDISLAKDILKKCEYGTLSTISDNGYPYNITLSYVYYKDCIYFHSAKEGHKIDNIRNNNKVCFSVVGNTQVLQERFSTKYESVVVFGTAYEIDNNEKELVLLKLVEKYSPDFIEEGKIYISKAKDATNVIKINIEHITGKAIY